MVLRSTGSSGGSGWAAAERRSRLFGVVGPGWRLEGWRTSLLLVQGSSPHASSAFPGPIPLQRLQRRQDVASLQGTWLQRSARSTGIGRRAEKAVHAECNSVDAAKGRLQYRQ